MSSAPLYQTEISPISEKSRLHNMAVEFLQNANIQVNGDRPWDIQLHEKGVLEEAMSRGNLGLGESYMDGAWDTKRLDEFFFHLMRSRLTDHLHPWRLASYVLAAKLFNRQTFKRAWQVGEKHYDLGNDFYAAMLDSRMTYTCGYWENASTLEQAQEIAAQARHARVGHWLRLG